MYVSESTPSTFVYIVIVLQIRTTFQTCTSVHEPYNTIRFSVGCYHQQLVCTNMSEQSYNERNLTKFLDDNGKKIDCYNSHHYCLALKISTSRLSTLNTTIFSNQHQCDFFEIELFDVGNVDLSFNVPGMQFALRRLILRDNNLTNIEADMFKELKYLLVLIMTGNKLRSLEINSFRGLSSLQTLFLDGNRIESIEPLTFAELSNLQILSLSNNKISALTPETFLGVKDLRELILTNNTLHEIPLGVFNNFPSLTSLQLANNYFKQFQVGTFSNLRFLKNLSLSFNQLPILNEPVFFPLISLRRLDLNNNKLSYIKYDDLLSHLSFLTYMKINYNKWNCDFLYQMLRTFRTRKFDFVVDNTNYTQENVEGILCMSYKYDEGFEGTNDRELFIKNITVTLSKLEENLYYASNNTFRLHESTIKHLQSFDTNLLLETIIIFLLSACICALGIFAAYKYCFKSNIKPKKNAKEHSEPELVDNELYTEIPNNF